MTQRQPTPMPPSDRRSLAIQYLPYVRHIAGKVKRSLAREIEFDDLVEYGMVGLFEAADRFDASHGANFTTFAFYRIRGAIYDGLRGMGWLSRTAYARARFEERANAYLGEIANTAGAHGAAIDDPNDPEKVHAASAPEHAVHSLTIAVQGLAAVYMTSLDAAQSAQLPDDSQPLPEERLALEQSRARVRRMLKKLPDDERRLLEMYYYKDMSLQQIGEKLGLSKSWTSRLHARVIDKLHRMLEDNDDAA